MRYDMYMSLGAKGLTINDTDCRLAGALNVLR